MSKILVIVGIALVGYGVYWYLQQQKKKEEGNGNEDVRQAPPAEEVRPQKDPYSIDTIIEAEEAFALGNLASGELNASLASVCSGLISVLPVMNEEFPHAEVTFKLNEMAQKIIPAKVGSFVALDAGTQISREAEFKQDMDKLSSVAKKADEVVRQTNLSKDERETLLIGIKY